MIRKADKASSSRPATITTNVDIPVDESLLVRQRLRNLCEIAIAIGQKQGLLGNQQNDDTAALLAEKGVSRHARQITGSDSSL